jgi:pimeloyl-ACP methyl ester carboxylesterase
MPLCTRSQIYFACISTILLAGLNSAVAQLIPPPTDINATARTEISQDSIDHFYTSFHATKRTLTPRIVFIPGIMGSSIQECHPDGSECSYIWGTAESMLQPENLMYTSDSRNPFRTDVVDSILFKDIYGDILNTIRNKAATVANDNQDDPLVTVFHYDWRQSNLISAGSLAQRICGIRANAPNSPIVILAHSMGGLAAKIWAARYASSICPGGGKPNVREMVFVATPFLGAPKTIKAIDVGYNIFFDELGRLNGSDTNPFSTLTSNVKSLFGYLERKYPLRAIDDAGLSFDSFLELMPIRSSDYCRKIKPKLAQVGDPVDDKDGRPINLFDVSVWERYDLLRRIDQPIARQAYYANLAQRLKNTETLLCRGC